MMLERIFSRQCDYILDCPMTDIGQFDFLVSSCPSENDMIL
jgi:aminopeptidase C